MKKLLLLPWILLLVQTSKAQEWELFPKDQVSYLQGPPGIGDSSLQTIIMDSVVDLGFEKQYFFRRNLEQDQIGDCNASDAYREFTRWGGWFSIDPLDSIIERNDTVFFSRKKQYISSKPFYFLKNIPLDSSWIIHNDYAGRKYHIEFTSEGLDTIFGIVDSVRVYQVTKDSGSGPSPGAGAKFILSKHYGFVRYIPFQDFLEYDPTLNRKDLIGFIKDTIQAGFQAYGYEDYFSLSPGDVMLYKQVDWCAGIMYFFSDISFIKDSITQVFRSSDSIVYQVERTYRDKNGVFSTIPIAYHKYYRNEYEPFILAPENHVAIGDVRTPFFDGPIIWFFYAAWGTSSQSVTSDLLPGTLVHEKSFYNALTGLDSADCKIHHGFDQEYGFTINSWQGFTRYADNNGLTPCGTTIDLVGSRIGGVDWGDLRIPLGLSERSSRTEIFLYPNPASDHIRIEGIPIDKPVDFQIIGPMGRIFQRGTITEPELNVSNLPAGIYQLLVNEGQSQFLGRFMKN